MRRPLIFVADPNAYTRELLEHLFAVELQALVTLLPSTSELAPMLHETVADLVVVEIGNDRRAEIAMIKELRALHPEVPFMVLTAWDLPAEPAMLERSTGADAVIRKPFRIEDVLATAQRLIADARASDVWEEDAADGRREVGADR